MSKIARPAVTTPPGQLIYMKMFFFGFSDSRNSNCAVTRLAIWSSIGPVVEMIRSRSSREKMSKLRSARLDCSMTMGTSCETMS